MEIMNMRAAEFGMDDPSFILNSLDDISSYSFGSSFGDPFHHSLSNPIFDLKRPIEPYQTSFDKPAKMAKTNSWESTISNNLSSPQVTFSNLMTFTNSNYPAHVKQETVPAKSFAREEPRKIRTTPRFPCNQDHIIAERKRREKLSQKFIALSALVPGLKKMDKASVLGDAIKHLKQLKEQVKELEEQTKKKTMESVVFVKKHELYGDDDGSSSDKNFSCGDSQDEPLPEIEARACDGKVLIRIHCEKKRGIVEKTISEIEKLNLSVLNSSVLTFGTSILDITIIAQMDTGFTISIIDLVKHLREVVKLFK